MGGIFGIVSKKDCVLDLFYATDYHSHLGTRRGGMAVVNSQGFDKKIHNIETAQFRSKFEDDIREMHGTKGIGVISDYEPQPITSYCHLGHYALVTVGKVSNFEKIVKKELNEKKMRFLDSSKGEINQTELISNLIEQGSSFTEGIEHMQDTIEGSCSLLLLTEKGLYVARDKLGRTPLVLGKKENDYVVALESCSFPNLDFKTEKYLGPGEIALITEDGFEQLKAPNDKMQICSFLWVYYGYPASSYEGINVEVVRNRCGVALAKADEKDLKSGKLEIDLVAGIPDSGTGHAIGYANESGFDYGRPIVKYTPTWPRSFMPQDQKVRDLVAKMKLIPIKELIQKKKIVFCEDSIVRGTQLQDNIRLIYELGAREIHMRPACPPLTYGCKFFNFSRSKSEMELASRKAMGELGIEFPTQEQLIKFSNPDSEEYLSMVERIRGRLGLASLKYQRLESLVGSIGLSKDKLCTYCWDGCEG